MEIMSLGISLISLIISYLTYRRNIREEERQRLSVLPILEILSSDDVFYKNNIMTNYKYIMTHDFNYKAIGNIEFKNYDYRQKVRVVIKNISNNVAYDLYISELIVTSSILKNILRNNIESCNLLDFINVLKSNKKQKVTFLRGNECCSLPFTLNISEFEKNDIIEKQILYVDIKVKICYRDIYSNNYEQYFYLKDIELNTIGEYKKIDNVDFELPPILSK